MDLSTDGERERAASEAGARSPPPGTRARTCRPPRRRGRRRRPPPCSPAGGVPHAPYGTRRRHEFAGDELVGARSPGTVAGYSPWTVQLASPANAWRLVGPVINSSGSSRPLTQPAWNREMGPRSRPFLEGDSPLPVGDTGAPVRAKPTATTGMGLLRGGRHGCREVSCARSVRDVGPGGEQAAMTQHLGDGLPAAPP